MPDGLSVAVDEYRGDVLAFRAGAIVNPWNRNFMPRWLLNPGGVSGGLKQLTGPEPWEELARKGILTLGEAVATGSGEFNLVDEIIHVAGLNLLWRASEASVYASAQNAAILARQRGHSHVSMPLIGSGHGGLTRELSRTTILTALGELPTHEPPLHITLVSAPDQGENDGT